MTEFIGHFERLFQVVWKYPMPDSSKNLTVEFGPSRVSRLKHGTVRSRRGFVSQNGVKTSAWLRRLAVVKDHARTERLLIPALQTHGVVGGQSDVFE